jgi:hypothetical protein
VQEVCPKILNALRSLPESAQADIQAAQIASGTIPDLKSADLWLSVTKDPFEADNVRRLSSAAGTGSLDKIKAVHFAVANYKIACGVIGELLNMAANVNNMDTDGNTPLHIAASMGYADKIELLLENGALACTKNKSGQTAKDLRIASLKSGDQFTACLVMEPVRSAIKSRRQQQDDVITRLEMAAREERVPQESVQETHSSENKKQRRVRVNSDVQREGLDLEDLGLKGSFPASETGLETQERLLKFLLPNTMRNLGYRMPCDGAGVSLMSALQKDYGGTSGHGRSMKDLDSDLDADGEEDDDLLYMAD